MSLAKRAAVAALVLAAVPGLSACSAGFNSATDKVTADNAAGESGGILARAIVLVKSRNAIPAALAGTLINRGNNDVLERVELTEQTPGAKTISIRPDIDIDNGDVLAFGTEDLEPITVPNAGDLRVGNFATVVLRFRTAGEIRLTVPVVTRTGFYSDIVPATSTRSERSETDRSRAGKADDEESPADGAAAEDGADDEGAADQGPDAEDAE